MSLRDFKKDIEYFIGEFIDDCTLFVSLNPGKNDEKVTTLLEEAVDLYNDMRDKANVKIEGKKGAYFAGLRKEAAEKIDGLYEQLSALVKAEEKTK